MNIRIRHEQAHEYTQVEAIARDAFWNLYFPGAHEHFVVHSMREHKDFMPELSFVIEVDGHIQGGIYYTHSKVILPQGEELKTVSFGPAFVAPAYHRQGLGRKLIEHSLALAKDLGHKGVLTLGYPYHYAPYGFVGAKKFGIAMGDGKFYKGLLALELVQGGLQGAQGGQAAFSDVFEVDPQAVDTFDATFPFKEKAVQPSQAEFEKSCVELDV